MFILNGEVTIGKYKFNTVYDIIITKSIDELGDVAEIKLPNRFKVNDGVKELYTETALKVEDKVTIVLGYEGKYKGVEFQGVVKKIKPTNPITIECEDSIWLLKRKNITKAWNTGTTLKAILQEVLSGTGIAIAKGTPELSLDKYIIKNKNGAQVLQEIKQSMSMSIFLNDKNELCCRLKHTINSNQLAIYNLNYNLVSNDLEFKEAESKRIKVRCCYVGKDYKKTEVEVGDSDGELRTFNTSVVHEEDKLKEMAYKELDQLKYEGFEGTITSFLLPYATRGMAAKIIDKENEGRAGKYFIRKVVTTFGLNGARRKITLGEKL